MKRSPVRLWQRFRKRSKSARESIASGWRKVSKYIIKPGPYETNFKERVTKMYLIPMSPYFFGFVEWLKWKMDVPGAKKGY